MGHIAEIVAHTDGGARGNPGPAAAGIVIENDSQQTLFHGGYYLGRTTNNVAEYRAIILGLEQAQKLGASQVDLFSDSELIVKQLKGQYKVKNANLKPLYEQVRELIAALKTFSVRHVYRENNSEADRLVNEALDAGGHVGDFLDGTPKQSRSSEISKNNTWPSSLIPLREQVRFDDRRPVCLTAYEKGGLSCRLLCLNTGQTFTIEAAGAATVFLLRGKGSIAVNHSKKAEMILGMWLPLAKSDSASIAADTGEQMVLLLHELTAG